MKEKSEELVWVDVEILKVRPESILVSDGDHEEWLPLSAIEEHEDDYEEGITTRILIPEKLAADKGLV
jgi:hypothetical protein